MKLHVFTIMSALSLVVCVNGATLGAGDSVPSNDHEICSIYFKSLHARYTLRVDSNRIGLYGPPLEGSDFARTHIAPKRVTRVLNSPLKWTINQMEDDPAEDAKSFFWVECSDQFMDSIFEALFPPSTRETVPALLEAMEDPDKFVAAHRYLRRESIAFQIPEPRPDKSVLTRRPDGSFFYDQDGLRVEFSHLKETGRGVAVGGPMTAYSCRMNVDSSQFSALLSRWHRRLDTPIVVVPYPRCIAAAARFWGSTR